MLRPYLGLGLLECLVEAGRPIEPWDTYRRALAVMPVEEVLVHLQRFNELRLVGPRGWHETDPDNAKVAHWLECCEHEALTEGNPAETLDAEPMPSVPLALPLAEGRELLGLDYRVEDVEAGPLIDVDFYVREGKAAAVRDRSIRRTVVKLAPNGAIAWDAVPDGARPMGWHGLVYSPDLTALVRQGCSLANRGSVRMQDISARHLACRARRRLCLRRRCSICREAKRTLLGTPRCRWGGLGLGCRKAIIAAT